MLAAALESMTDAVFISDESGRFIEFNDAFASFHRFGTKAECARHLDEYPEILDVFMDDGEPAPLEKWAVPRALRGETARNAEYTLRRKDTGETWVGSYSFSPIRDDEGVIVGSVVVVSDITDRKRAEEALGDPAARRRIDFQVDDLPEAFGDASLMWQAWVNLLSNAVKFSSTRERPRIRVEGNLSDGEAVYRIRDNGVGFDRADVGKLFGVFQRLHSEEEFPGTGIGLSLVRRIVERHGGRVWAEGEVGTGATFSFSLPVQKEPGPTAVA